MYIELRKGNKNHVGFHVQGHRNWRRIFVECHNLTEARVILEMSGFEEEELEFCGRYTVAEAEAIGLDTY